MTICVVELDGRFCMHLYGFLLSSRGGRIEYIALICPVDHFRSTQCQLTARWNCSNLWSSAGVDLEGYASTMSLADEMC